MKNNARTSTATQAAKAAIDPPSPPPAPIDPLFLAAPQVATFVGTQPLTNASGFFFERDGRLYLVTSRHVLFDEGSDHRPDRIEIGLHVDATDLTQSTGFSVPLYDDGIAVWHQGSDSGGEIDVAVIELDRTAFPAKAVVAAFTPAHIQTAFSAVPADTALRVVGFPLGFHDTVHYLPVLRHAAIASPFGIRFQRQGYFLTDARTHRGTSGAAVVMRDAQPSADTAALPWKLMGVHSSRMDMGNRDLVLDESLGLNCAWYADILLTLTAA
ncbi:trypsin-like peptidase domain-containing protein [Hydrogenophaga sp. BPS33]|uniref:trypsin-like peptidase domain-containing protein n=1 Tax=Hydrogenophaga sp. BPS33 TaxID=2651974 RepID=UPI0013203E0E|nr:trypsin-like peptidase domain-containing protein [Hydrogenophaga sp. BPS33]QHE88177.1 trypsin-like peptidase domain-containing protein [Hydrogenophaga sp. BPS33]